MCISNAMVSPPTDPKGEPIVCFNPYLDQLNRTDFNSNCMSFHARATMPGVPYTPTYLPNGWTDLADPQIFGGQTKTDFVWAIQSGAK
jgi:hypothetical protein